MRSLSAPNSNEHMFFDELSALIRKIDYNKHFMLAGDFNIYVLNETKYGVSKYLDTRVGQYRDINLSR